jgi:hypothetical protein
MSISQADLRNAAARVNVQRSAAGGAGRATAFLCHSHRDRALALGLQELLREQGLDLYIDWQDAEMPDQPNSETADRLRRQIVDRTWFIFLATANSMASRWCPWELGYADGRKPPERIAIVPTRDGSTTHGNEYLQLYPRIDQAATGLLAKFAPNAPTGTYVKFL